MNHTAAKDLLVNLSATGTPAKTARKVRKVIADEFLTIVQKTLLENYAQHLSAKEKAGRKVALLKAENQLLKLRERLEAVGYQDSDEVFDKLQSVIFAVRRDTKTAVAWEIARAV